MDGRKSTLHGQDPTCSHSFSGVSCQHDFFFCGSAAADSKQISFTAGSDNNDQHLFARSSLERLPPVELLMGT